MKKRKLSEDFELIYLRHGEARKNLHKVTDKELKDPDVQRIIKFSTKKWFDRNSRVLLGSGYNFEDLQSIITIYAATFIGSGFKGKTHRGTGLLMMNFIDQRVLRYLEWVKRKFSLDEIVNTISFSTNDSLYATLRADGGLVPTALSKIEVIDELEFAIGKLSSNTDPASKRKMRSMKDQRVLLKRDLAKQRKDSKNKTIELKDKINTDHDEYTDELVYYSTSKHVSKDIRSAARKYCKKFNIDYRTLIQAVLRDGDYDIKEFTF